MSGDYFWPVLTAEQAPGFVSYVKVPMSSREYRRVMRALARFIRRPTLIHKGGKP